MTPAQHAHSLRSQIARLVESALLQLARMQRHRNHHHLPRRILIHQLRYRIRKPAAQLPRYWRYTVVLERVDRAAHRTLVDAETDRPHKRWRRHAADAAQTGLRNRHKEIFSTANAAGLASRRQLVPASLTHRGCGNGGKQSTAEQTSGRKK